MNIAIIGTGYVGLVTGAVLSEIGHTVTCLDINEEKIAILRSGISPIYEPGLEEIIKRNIALDRLFFTTNATDAFYNAEIIFIAVGTPQREDGAADLFYIEQATKDIAANVNRNAIIVVKSTVPVGTNDRIEAIIQEHMHKGLHIHVVSNPEFLREGHAIHDTFHGDRIVIGAEDEGAGYTVAALFDSIDIPVLHTNRRSAEMIKYASNAFLAVKISYINQISNLCEAVGADIHAVADGMGMDKRIGRAFLNAGLGYGGSCFPKDTEALAFLGRQHAVSTSIVDAAIDANANQRQLFIEKVVAFFEGNVLHKRISVLGLSFKPNTDDMREAPSIDIIKSLAAKGARVTVFDPVVKHTNLLDDFDILYAASKEDCIDNTDAILLITEWDDFIDNDWLLEQVKANSAVLFDGRNMVRNDLGEFLC